METTPALEEHWFVMRDLTRPNAKQPAYKQLGEKGLRVFTPMTSKIALSGGKRVRTQVPFVHDLLFVRAAKENLDKIVGRTETLQYRFVKGAPYRTPMTVPERDMDRFIAAVTRLRTPRYYTPEEITPAMRGARVRMVGQSPLDGLEGTLLKIKGARKKRLLVELPGLLAASIEVLTADYVELLPPQ